MFILWRKVANENIGMAHGTKLEGDNYSQIFIDADGNRINSEKFISV